jgi:ppGpp synthetase/RelA/SpoT-type nucleotidyltranferase
MTAPSPSGRRTPLTGEKPGSWAEFTQLLIAHGLTIDDSDRARRYFESTQVALLNNLRSGEFFKKLPGRLESLAEQYFTRTKTPLFLDASLANFELQKKSFDSAIDKAYRLNVVWNRDWPKPPRSGEWIVPDNWHNHLDDLVRGIFVCKYMDGPLEACKVMSDLAKEEGVESFYSSRQLDDGYYAYHFYVTLPVEFAAKDWNTTNCNLKIEVQVTTQLQELGRNLTHQVYVTRRSQLDQDKHAWKWDHSSEQFKAGYVAHTLHLIEGLIVDMRNKSLPDIAPSTSTAEKRND